MCPPSIYQQLPHFYNHGLAIPFYFIWKENFEECFSPRLSSKSLLKETEHWKKRERKSIEKRGRKKTQRVSANKMEKSIFW
jgi:hypothetical protein